MSDEPKKRWWTWTRWPALGILVFVLYVLSAGPAWWVCIEFRDYPARDWILNTHSVVYAPLTWACERSETCRSLSESYLGWWTPTVVLPATRHDWRSWPQSRGK